MIASPLRLDIALSDYRIAYLPNRNLAPRARAEYVTDIADFIRILTAGQINAVTPNPSTSKLGHGSRRIEFSESVAALHGQEEHSSALVTEIAAKARADSSKAANFLVSGLETRPKTPPVGKVVGPDRSFCPTLPPISVRISQ